MDIRFSREKLFNQNVRNHDNRTENNPQFISQADFLTPIAG